MARRRVYAILFAGVFAAGFMAGWFLTERRAPVAENAVLRGGSYAPDSAVASSSLKIVSASDLDRVARVIDGDTIELAGGDKIRYIGIDAPETVDPRKPVQCFGVEASSENKKLVEGQLVRLAKDISERDKYGRLLRYVYLEDGTFVNLELVRNGYASASTYPPDVKHAAEFSAAEREARGAKRGLWGVCSGLALPVVSQSATAVADVPPSENCLIKGNISSDGSKIYHLPGCPYYDKTKIDEARGERWFCSEADAAAAGWRKAANCP